MSNYPLPITHNVKARDPVGSKNVGVKVKGQTYPCLAHVVDWNTEAFPSTGEVCILV